MYLYRCKYQLKFSFWYIFHVSCDTTSPPKELITPNLQLVFCSVALPSPVSISSIGIPAFKRRKKTSNWTKHREVQILLLLKQKFDLFYIVYVCVVRVTGDSLSAYIFVHKWKSGKIPQIDVAQNLQRISFLLLRYLFGCGSSILEFEL